MNLVDIKTSRLIENDYHDAKGYYIILDGVEDLKISIKFISENRTDTGCQVVIKYKDKSFSKDYSMKYACRDKLDVLIIKDIKDTLSANLVITVKMFWIELEKMIYDCMSKCESRYGNRVKDYELHNCDAFIEIYSEVYKEHQSVRVDVFTGDKLEAQKILENRGLELIRKYDKENNIYIAFEKNQEYSELSDKIIDTLKYYTEENNYALYILLHKGRCYIKIEDPEEDNVF